MQLRYMTHGVCSRGWEACHAGKPPMPVRHTGTLDLYLPDSPLQLGKVPCSPGPTAVAAAQPELVCTSRSCRDVRPK